MQLGRGSGRRVHRAGHSDRGVVGDAYLLRRRHHDRVCARRVSGRELLGQDWCLPALTHETSHTDADEQHAERRQQPNQTADSHNTGQLFFTTARHAHRMPSCRGSGRAGGDMPYPTQYLERFGWQ
jgi:hypothetical protein